MEGIVRWGDSFFHAQKNQPLIGSFGFDLSIDKNEEWL
jgi:hypothetical protein